MLRFLARRSLLTVLALVAACFGGIAYAYWARTGAGNPRFAQARANDPLALAYGCYVHALTLSSTGRWTG